MFALLAQRNVALLWAGHTVSILGDYIFFIAITFWVYERTGSALATGTVLISSALPLMLFAPLAGRVVDRWERRRVMLLAEGARGLLFLALLCAIVWRPGALWPIYVVSFAQSALAAFYWPARSATLPRLVARPSLLAANALYLFSDGAVRVVAPTLAALALLWLGAAGVIAFDAATFVISAGCVALLTPLPRGVDSAVAPPSPAVAAPRPIVSRVPNGKRRLWFPFVQPGKPTARLNTLVGAPNAIYAVGGVIAFVGGRSVSCCPSLCARRWALARWRMGGCLPRRRWAKSQ